MTINSRQPGARLNFPSLAAFLVFITAIGCAGTDDRAFRALGYESGRSAAELVQDAGTPVVTKNQLQSRTARIVAVFALMIRRQDGKSEDEREPAEKL